MRLKIAKRGELEILTGIVTNVQLGTGNAENRLVSVTICGTVYDKIDKVEKEQLIEVAFWNSEVNDTYLCDRIKLVGIKKGDFVSVLVRMKENNHATAYGFRFMGAAWNLPPKNEMKELNIFLGTVASVKEDAENRFFRISVPSKVNGETTWNSITFWNNETGNMADRAKMCLKPRADGTKVKAAIVCGAKSLYNDIPCYTGYRFELLD